MSTELLRPPAPIPQSTDFELTDEQRAAVEWGDGPLMVLAGAGTGKTTVVVERVRRLLQQDETLLSENILVLTYNVRAANELSRRLEQALGINTAARVWVGNFHSFGYRLLRDNRAELGLSDTQDLLDDIGQRLLLRELRPRFGHFLYNNIGAWRASTDGFAEVISRAKDELVTPAEYRKFVDDKRIAFQFRHGIDAWDAALAELQSQRTDSRLMRGARETRNALRGGDAEADAAADRAARRDASGINYAVGWSQLDAQQTVLAMGLKQTYLRNAEAFEVVRLSEQAEVYELYQQELHRRGQLDYGEQQLRAIELLHDRPNILLRYQQQFRHVLVDEFQDANMAQIALLELIGRGPDKPDNVVVVGDDDQSIYRFRGASYAAFSQFKERFSRPPDWDPTRPAQTVAKLPLLQNRRSTARILSAADRLISHNTLRLKAGQPLLPIKMVGQPVEVVFTADEIDEADSIASRIRDAYAALPEPKHWNDIAVLYRMHRHRDRIVEQLRRQGIPFSVIGGTGLFVQPDVRDVEAALRVIANPADSVAFVRLLSAGPWRLDALEIMRMRKAAAWDGRPVYDAAVETLRGELGDPPTEMLRTKLDRLLACLNDLVPRGTRDAPFTLLEEYLVRTNLLHDLIATGTADAQRSVLAIARLMRFVADWQRNHPMGSLREFVDYLDIYQDLGGDLDTEQPLAADAQGVLLMTIYQAKGLEYEVVIVPRLIEGQFPTNRGENLPIPVELLKQKPPEDFEVDEERRLLFVAMTRAKQRLILTAPTEGLNKEKTSRFAGEVVADEPPDVTVTIRQRPPDAQTDTDDAAATLPTEALLKLMPVPDALERRFSLRRRAVELIGALERLAADDDAGRQVVIDELVQVAMDSAGEAEAARREGIDPLTLRVLTRHGPAGKALLELVPETEAFSASSLSTYNTCPALYAFDRLYRIPTDESKGYFEFGTSVHAAYETFVNARLAAEAAGTKPPDFDDLKRAFEDTWHPRAYDDQVSAESYRQRSEPALRKFYDRELTSLSQAVGVEEWFEFELTDSGGGAPVRFHGKIDRIDRLPDGSIEIIDYKTGRSKTQGQVDKDDQLSIYSLALREGAVLDKSTGQPLPPASSLALYFTESDQKITTTRSDEQLDEFVAKVWATVRRIRSGDFVATPSYSACGYCDFRRICPSRFGADRI